jgi:hypothetical protein
MPSLMGTVNKESLHAIETWLRCQNSVVVLFRKNGVFLENLSYDSFLLLGKKNLCSICQLCNCIVLIDGYKSFPLGRQIKKNCLSKQ